MFVALMTANWKLFSDLGVNGKAEGTSGRN